MYHHLHVATTIYIQESKSYHAINAAIAVRDEADGVVKSLDICDPPSQRSTWIGSQLESHYRLRAQRVQRTNIHQCMDSCKLN